MDELFLVALLRCLLDKCSTLELQDLARIICGIQDTCADISTRDSMEDIIINYVRENIKR